MWVLAISLRREIGDNQGLSLTGRAFLRLGGPAIATAPAGGSSVVPSRSSGGPPCAAALVPCSSARWRLRCVRNWADLRGVFRPRRDAVLV
jgi:hypothetical protein